MSKGVAPSAPLPDFDTNTLQSHHAPPPSYDQAMASYPPAGPTTSQNYVPPPSQLPYPSLPQQQYPQVPSGYPPGQTPYQMPQPQPQGFVPVTNQPQSTQPTPMAMLQPLPQQTVATVIVNGPVAVGPKPCRVRCPMCHADIKTSTVSENQTGAHVACVILCLLGCWFCCCIPYCMDSFKIVQHKCPVCKSYLGTYKG